MRRLAGEGKSYSSHIEKTTSLPPLGSMPRLCEEATGKQADPPGDLGPADADLALLNVEPPIFSLPKAPLGGCGSRPVLLEATPGLATRTEAAFAHGGPMSLLLPGIGVACSSDGPGEAKLPCWRCCILADIGLRVSPLVLPLLPLSCSDLGSEVCLCVCGEGSLLAAPNNEPGIGVTCSSGPGDANPQCCWRCCILADMGLCVSPLALPLLFLPLLVLPLLPLSCSDLGSEVRLRLSGEGCWVAAPDNERAAVLVVLLQNGAKCTILASSASSRGML